MILASGITYFADTQTELESISPVLGFIAIISETGNRYLADGAQWVLKAAGATLPDAPNNTNEYVRKGGAWEIATGGGGGGISYAQAMQVMEAGR